MEIPVAPPQTETAANARPALIEWSCGSASRPADVARRRQACFLVAAWETAPIAGARTSHSPMVTTIEVT